MADGPVRVLVIEDNVMLAGAVRHLLQLDGCLVTVAHDAATARAAIASGAVDVVLADHHLPGPTSGAELLAHVRDVHPRARRVLSSGIMDEPDVRRCVAEGVAHALLEKPFGAEALRAITRR
jgi:CheY-like chemotaxis protein